ncbi:MAG TPA: polyphosphate kinase [Alphaproteobacteria bacterium]
MARERIELSRKKLRLDKVAMRRRFKSKDDYLARESQAQKDMLALQQAYFHQGLRGVIVFEGWDASGKGGAIRRLTARLDPRGTKVWPIGPPGADEQGRHYLYRFWARLPTPGTIAVFDRSWYGRVLVERVDELVEAAAWQRAYDEINQFEHLLLADGVRLAKLFLHITPDEQLRRFQERLHNPFKRWKLTADDLRNRAHWDAYKTAYEDMFDRTSTREAPWTVIAGDHKWTARVQVLEEVTAQLGRGIDVAPPPLDPGVVAAAESALGLRIEPATDTAPDS